MSMAHTGCSEPLSQPRSQPIRGKHLAQRVLDMNPYEAGYLVKYVFRSIVETRSQRRPTWPWVQNIGPIYIYIHTQSTVR